MESSTKSEAFAVIKAARHLLNDLPSSIASEATQTGYERELNRLITKNQTRTPDQLWAAVCQTNSKRTYYRRIAAIRYGLRRFLEDGLRQQDALQRANNEEAWHQKVQLLRWLIDLHALTKRHEGTCPLTAPAPRHSKRQDLRGLPADWRERMHAGLQNSKYRLAYLVGAATGCRPAELEHGIEVVATTDAITFRITGAKVKATQGQPWREIRYAIGPDTHPLVEALYDEIRPPTSAIVRIKDKNNYTSALRRVGRKLWPRRQAEITPYCLRHAAANDFKAHLTPEAVSVALGHAVDATASLYGQRQMSHGGGLRPAAVHAERSIKPTRSVHPRGPQQRPRL